MNFCTSCKTDFASVSAFDRHRVGRHAYTFREGLEMVPMRDDGRRCLDTFEMRTAGLQRDRRGRWAIVGDPERFQQVRAAA